MTTDNEIVERLLAGDRRTLARLISRIENDGHEAIDALVALYPHTGQAHIVGVTGAPGTGKSTLVNELTKALECFDTVERIVDEPDAPGFDLRVGEAYLRLGRLEDAYERLERAAEKDPQSLPALMLLGDCLLAMGKSEKAANSFRRILAVDNTDPYAHHNLAVCFFGMGNYRAGLDHCLQALKHKPDYAFALHKAVIAYLINIGFHVSVFLLCANVYTCCEVIVQCSQLIFHLCFLRFKR